MDIQQLLGRRLGDYQLRQFVGRGGMGAVFLADHAYLDLPYAVKVLAPSLALDESYLRRFFHEAKQAARIQNPHVVTVHTAGKVDGFAYMAMEYVPGLTLKRAVTFSPDKRLDPEVAVETVRQALLGVQAAHELGIIHRDIKPDNLLLAPDGTVKVADFGLARTIELDTDGMTRPGQVLGTPGFMAIEQWENQTVDARTDLYAMGVTLYYLLSGQLPYTTKSISSLLMQLAKGQATPIEAVAPHLDAALAKIVHRLISREREKRPESVAAALELLDGWCQDQQTGEAAGKKLTELADRLGVVAGNGTKREGVPGTSAAHDVGSIAATMTDHRDHEEAQAPSDPNQKNDALQGQMEVSRLVAVPAQSQGIDGISEKSLIDLMHLGEEQAASPPPPPPPARPQTTTGERREFEPVAVAAKDPSQLYPSERGSRIPSRRRIFAPPKEDNDEDTEAFSARPQRKSPLKKALRFLANSLGILLVLGMIGAGIYGGYWLVEELRSGAGPGVFGADDQAVRVIVVRKREPIDEHVQAALNLSLPNRWRHETVELHYTDVRYDPDNVERAIDTLERTIGVDPPVVAVVCIGYGGMLRDIAEVTEPRDVPLLSPYATDPSLVTEHERITMLAADERAQGERMARFAQAQLEPDSNEPRAAIIYEPARYSREKADAFERVFEESGRVVGTLSVREHHPRDLVRRIGSLDIQVVFMPIPWSQVEPILAHADSRGAWQNKLVLGTDTWHEPAIFTERLDAFESMAGFYVSHFHPFEERSLVEALRENMREHVRDSMSSLLDARVALGHDTGLLLADALRRAIDKHEGGPPERDTLHAELRTSDGLTGASGPITIEAETGRAIKRLRLLECTPRGPRPVEH